MHVKLMYLNYLRVLINNQSIYEEKKQFKTSHSN
nr:MAG TPA: hypothetical protein [Caudoviricetes sp.]